MKSKLNSRKLWVTVLTATLLSLADQLGMSHATAQDLAGVVAAYLVAQSAHDVALIRGAK